jgi:glucokinase
VSVKKFLEQVGAPVTVACLGVAGPVVDGKARITNLPWRLEETALSKALNIPRVKLLNDLEATAWAVPILGEQDLVVVYEGRPAPGGNIAVIAPGTGLGEAYLTWDGRRYLAYACEGGHTSFAPQSDLEMELLRDFRKRYGHVSYERVCSGLMIPQVYGFLRDRTDAAETAGFAQRLSDAADPTRVIIEAALDGEAACDLCTRTLDLFVTILGAEAGNLALKIMATGGVYVAGGIGMRLAEVLKQGPFRDAFLHKGRMSALVKRMSVYVIVNPRAALLGAACWGLQL